LDHIVTTRTLKDVHFGAGLEIGCGTGKNTLFYATICDTLISVDFSESMIEKAKIKLRERKNVQFNTMDITIPWSYPDASFDIVSCNLLLDHIQNIDFVFMEAFRVLKTGGKFFLCEYHPFRQYQQKAARIGGSKGGEHILSYRHDISQFLTTALKTHLSLEKIEEHWLEEDQFPRLVSFLFKT